MFTLSDPAMEVALFDAPIFREFTQLEEFSWFTDESTIFLRFRPRLEKHNLSERGLLLKVDTAVDVTLIAAPSTKKKTRSTIPKRTPAKKANSGTFA